MNRILIQALAAIAMVVLLSAAGMTAEQAEPSVSIDIADHPYTGLSIAPITIVVFSDYL